MAGAPSRAWPPCPIFGGCLPAGLAAAGGERRDRERGRADVTAEEAPPVPVLPEAPTDFAVDLRPTDRSVVGKEATEAAVTFCAEVRTTVVGGLRQARLPGFCSFLVGIALVAAYYGGGDATRPAFDALADLRSSASVLFAVVSTAIFGGLLPSILLYFVRKLPQPFWLSFLYNMVLWAWLGFVVDQLYRLQSFLFGDEPNVSTVVCKVLFDQFVYNPGPGVPMLVALSRFRDIGFSVRRCGDVFKPRPFLLAYVSTLLLTWGTWIPGTSVVYAFPTALQIPAFNIILFSFSVVISLISRSTAGAQGSGQAASEAPDENTKVDEEVKKELTLP